MTDEPPHRGRGTRKLFHPRIPGRDGLQLGPRSFRDGLADCLQSTGYGLFDALASGHQTCGRNLERFAPDDRVTAEQEILGEAVGEVRIVTVALDDAAQSPESYRAHDRALGGALGTRGIARAASQGLGGVRAEWRLLLRCAA